MGNLFDFLLFGSTNGPYGMSLEEMYYLNNEEVRDTSICLILEMRELKDKGYTMQEIYELIEDCFPLKDFDLKDSDFLKRDAIKNLKIIYRKERND